MGEFKQVNDILRRKAEELASGARSAQEAVERIAGFVRDEILYRLDEWDTGPEDVLRKGYGMCAGKALLAVELFRAIQIPVRFKVLQIFGEEGLFNFIAQRLEESSFSQTRHQDRKCLLNSIRSLPPQRDHVIVQVFLKGRWTDLDVARDKRLDHGMRVLGIWRQRQVLAEQGPFDSIDQWLKQRMQRRTVHKCRQIFFEVANQQIDKIRRAGEEAQK